MTDQNKITLEAVESDGSCDGCVCHVSGECVAHKLGDLSDLFVCTKSFRADGKEVIWTISKPSKPSSPEPEFND